MKEKDRPERQERLSAITRKVIVTGTLYGVSQAVIIAILAPLGIENFLRAQLSFRAESVEGIFTAWRNAGLMERYALHLLPDMVHPLWYSLFLSLLIRRLRERGRGALAALPFAAALLDVVENIFHAAFVFMPGALAPLPAALSAAAAWAKWIIAAASMLAICALALRALGRTARAGR